jgi:hypothetical protein
MSVLEMRQMSPLGKRIWLYMREHDLPLNRSALSEKWKKDGTFPVSPQSISNYLYRDHPPPEFINAIVRTFRLGAEQERELHRLYFRGRVERGEAMDPSLKAVGETDDPF